MVCHHNCLFFNSSSVFSVRYAQRTKKQFLLGGTLRGEAEEIVEHGEWGMMEC